MGRISNATLRALFAEFGAMCAISDCPYPNKLPDETPNVAVAHIYASNPDGPRYSPHLSAEHVDSRPNLLLLCPTHHEYVDRMPDEYTAEKLLLIRKWHVERVATILAGARWAETAGRKASSRLDAALAIWQRERGNDSEEYWQNLFTAQPELLGRV